jgi:hypothetical protein
MDPEVLQRQMDVEEVINAQMYTILTITKHNSNNSTGDHLDTQKVTHSEISV